MSQTTNKSNPNILDKKKYKLTTSKKTTWRQLSYKRRNRLPLYVCDYAVYGDDSCFGPFPCSRKWRKMKRNKKASRGCNMRSKKGVQHTFFGLSFFLCLFEWLDVSCSLSEELSLLQQLSNRQSMLEKATILLSFKKKKKKKRDNAWKIYITKFQELLKFSNMHLDHVALLSTPPG